MAKLSIGDEARRVLDFNLGMRNGRVRRALAAYGFGEADLEEGWRLLSQLTAHKLDYQPNLFDPRLLGQLDEWENRWFPIAEVVLRMHYPEAHAIVFLNLAQTTGAEVLVSVQTFLDRLDAIAKPRNEGGLAADGRAARKLLQKRGLDDRTIDEARALLAQIGAAEEPAPEPDPGDAGVEAEENLWKWYLEWSAIARVAIRDRRLLRSLGFLRTVRKASGEEVDEVVTDEELDTDEPPARHRRARPEPARAGADRGVASDRRRTTRPLSRHAGGASSYALRAMHRQVAKYAEREKHRGALGGSVTCAAGVRAGSAPLRSSHGGHTSD